MKPIPTPLFSYLIGSALSLALAAGAIAAVPATITAAVSEAGDYQLIYEVEIPAVNEWGGSDVPYAIDNSASPITFDRIAYVMELDGEWVWVSFEAFTPDLAGIGVPVMAAHPVPLQQRVKSMNVFSNVGDELRVQTGNGLSGGNIEFWGGNYAPANALRIPGADDGLYDFGDTMTDGGHGSMQVHHFGAEQVVFAFNNWGSNNVGAPGGLGIGSQPTGQPDWTFAGNSPSYTTRKLYVLVRQGATPNFSLPQLVAASASAGLEKIALVFDEPLAASSATLANFAIDGLTVIAAEVFAGDSVVLTTSPQTVGTRYTVSFTGISDLEGNTIADTEMVDVTPPAIPALLAEIPAAASYELIYCVDIPEDSPAWGAVPVPYTIDESRFNTVPGFDRVGYILELDGQWVFVSFDALSNDLRSIGIPNALATAAPIQTAVTNMDVFSNINDADIVTTGTGLSGGNIEFWPGNYSEPNSLGIPNADPATFDFGDTPGLGVGYGSMQVHNHEASQVIFAFNRWASGGADNFPDVGIGTNPAGQPDYTFAQNARAFTTRKLYVLARPGDPVDLTPDPPLVSALIASVELDKLHVQFDQAMGPTAADPANYTIAGLSVTGASFTPEGDAVILTTSPMQAGTSYMLAPASAITEAGPGTQAIEAGTQVEFSTFAVPPVFGDFAELGLFSLTHHLQIPDSALFNFDGVPYSVNEPLFGPRAFQRVAYALVLDSAAGEEWVFVSFDAHTDDVSKVGVPTKEVGEWQQAITNLNVYSNISDPNRLTPGLGLAGGNIEFWGFNYSGGNGAGVPNADDATFDFGDTRSTGGGYGSMQVHNHDASEVVFAYNRWGEFDGPDDLGIGSNLIGENPDWTFQQNANFYTAKDLYVFVGSGGALPPFEILDITLNAAGDLATIRWNSLPGVAYAADCSPDMQSWDEIDDDIASDGLVTTRTFAVTPGRGFFRVRRF